MPSSPTLTIFTSSSSLSIESESNKSECPCSNFGCFFRYAEAQFDDIQVDGEISNKEFHEQMVSLFQNIWIASYTHKLTMCILGAVRACIQACNRCKVPNEYLAKFYDLRMEKSSLPASIILHSALDKTKVSPRQTLLQIILDQIPLTASARDELYCACAKPGCDPFFNQVHENANSRQLQLRLFPPAEASCLDLEIGKDLRLRAGFVESVKVKRTMDGFQLKWAIPDLLQAIRSDIPFCTEFVVRDHVWGAYFGILEKNELGFKMNVLEPSRDEGSIQGCLTVSRRDPNAFLSSVRSSSAIKLDPRSFPKDGVPTWGFRDICVKNALSV